MMVLFSPRSSSSLALCGLLAAAATTTTTAAFTVDRMTTRTFSSSSPSALSMSTSSSSDRRSAIRDLMGGAAVTLAGIVASSSPTPANAAGYENEWLSEPTEEFLKNEAKAAEFKREQLKIKFSLQKILDRLVKESKTEEELVKDLYDISDLIGEFGGLPLGIKKEDVYKQVRSKKSKGFWPTNVEVAYQDLIIEIAKTQSTSSRSGVSDE